MIFGSTSLIFCVVIVQLQLGVILSAGDYSTQCQGTATTCDLPTASQLERVKKSLSEGGCTKDNTKAERTRFVLCAANFYPELAKNITDLINSDQQCRDEIDFKFQEPGILGECEIFGTPLENCFTRCVACLRFKAFGYDPTEMSIQSYEACKMNTTSSYGTSS